MNKGFPHPEILSKNGCVVSYCPQSSAVGTRVLREGGNAIDAAVATALSLAVTYPQAGNLGGGGFLLFHHADGRNYVLDYREKASRNVRREQFLQDGVLQPEKAVLGALAVCVPG